MFDMMEMVGMVNATTQFPTDSTNYDSTAVNLRETSNLTLECNSELNDGALFEFITNGILLNLVGLFGLFGNVISMIILSRPQMKSSINYLLIGLARCDTVLIITAVR